MKSRFGTDTEGPASSSEGQVTDSDAQALRALAEEIAREAAPRLEQTALVLYDRDPGYLQAQWYVMPQALAEARCLFPGDGADLRQVLRLCRLDRDGHTQVVASTPQGSGASEGIGEDGFALPGDGYGGGAEYSCELGLESDAGGWLLLARSNRVRSADRCLPEPPRTTPIPDDPQTRTQNTSPATAEEPSELGDIPVEAALAAVGEPLHPVFPNLELDDASIPAEHPAPSEEASVQIQPEDRKPESPPSILHDPAPHLETGAETPADDPVEAALAAVGEPLYPVFPNLESDDELPGHPPSLGEAAGQAWSQDRGPESLSGIPQYLGSYPETTTDLPPGVDLVDMPPPLLPSSPGLGLGTDDMLGPLYDPRAALSSAVLFTKPPMPDLELHAELIVHGRAAGDSTVDLFGHPIRVGADGNFYIRRPIDISALESLAVGDGLLPWQRTTGHG